MKNIYVGNLSFNTSDASLQQAFEAHGAVSRVKVITDRETGRPRGFAFVEMPNDDEGNAAIQALNGTQLDNRSLTVNEARERQPRGGGGGGGRY